MIRYEADFPPDLRPLVEPVLNRWTGLIPTWCQEFIVRYDSRQEGRMAAQVNYRNRWAVLIVTAGWLDGPPQERECSVVHELVHLALEPLASAAGRIVEDVTDDGSPLRSLADSMLADNLEASVEDLARAILRVAA